MGMQTVEGAPPRSSTEEFGLHCIGRGEIRGLFDHGGVLNGRLDSVLQEGSECSGMGSRDGSYVLRQKSSGSQH